MLQTLNDIITKIPSDATLYISNFMPKNIFEKLREKNFTLKLLPVTLTGLIDTKRIKPFNPDEKVHIIYYPFFHNDADANLLKALQKTHHFQLHKLDPEAHYHFEDIQTLFQQGLQASKDLQLGPITPSNHFIIYLAPYMFCPKDEIIERLIDKGVALHTDLKGLYAEPYFENVKKDHLTAHECRLSFIALDCDITPKQAALNVTAILETLDDHALRRCSF
jgi:hypothetical protein